MKTVSSQRHLDFDIVEEKKANKDYTVHVTPVFSVDGEEFRAIVDGHHSFAAAMDMGEDVNFVEVTASEDDRVSLLDNNVDDYLEAAYMDSEWYDVYTGITVF